MPDLRECVPVGAGKNTTSAIASHDVYTLGEFKDDQIQNITGGLDNTGGRGTSGAIQFKNFIDVGPNGDPTAYAKFGSWSFDASRVARTGTTTHGKQVGVNYIIKY